MNVGRIAAAALLIATVGLMTGGALATVAGTPASGPAPVVGSVTYTIASTLPGHVGMFAPYVQMVASPGAVQVTLISHSVWAQVYQLQGSSFSVLVMPGTSVTSVATVGHAGTYAWIAELPTPGVVPGAAVGMLTVA
jgi:hypothetical protein